MLQVGGLATAPVTTRRGLRKMGKCEITVDSGAEESVWPAGWLNEEPTKTIGVEKKMFIAANGQEMGHYGRREVKLQRVGVNGQIMSLSFEVTEVTKPLVTVRRITEHGNEVRFTSTGGWVENREKGTKIPLERKGGCYVLSVDLLADVMNTESSSGFTWQA